MKSILMLSLVLILCQAAWAQNPTYELLLKNDALASDTVYEFDVYLQRTGATALELASVQPIMFFNTSISTGTLTFSVVSGTSQLDVTQQPTTVSISGNVLRVNPRTPPGSGNGTIIPTSPGLRVARFRLKSNVAFEPLTADIIWKNAGNPFARTFAYVGGVNTEITDSTGHLNQLNNPNLSLLLISTTSPRPNAIAGTAYNDTLQATGGTPPYSWSISAGALPSGLSLSSDGIISGTATVAGVYNFTAQVTDDATTSTTRAYQLTVNPGSLNKLAFTQQPTTTTAGSTITPAVTVQLKDAFNNNISQAGVSISLAISSGTGSLGGTATQATNSSGLATFSNLSITAAGVKQLTATSSGLTQAVSNNFIINTAAASQLVFVQQPTNTLASATITPAITVQVQDQYGNNVSDNGRSVTMSLSSGTGTLSGTTTQATNPSGLATFSNLSINAIGSKQFTAASSGVTSAISNTFAIQAGAATQVVFIQEPTNDTAGTAITPAITAQLRDAGGNDVATADVSITLSLLSGTGTLSGTTARITSAAGLATFNDISIAAAGVKQLRVASSGLTSDTSANFTISPAAASQLVFIQQPSNDTAGTTITPAITVQLRDAFGNDVAASGVAVIASLSSGTGTLSGTTTRNTNASGLATFNDLSINLAGVKQLTAASGILTSAVSNNFTVTPAAANRVAFVQQPTNTSAGASVSPAVTVQIRDQFNNDIAQAGISVSVALTTGTGTLSGTTTQATNASGLATFNNLSINLPGSKNITASSSGLTSAISSSFTITTGTATKILVETASNGSGTVVSAQNITAGNSITVYAIARDVANNFVENIAADSWTLQNVSGGIVSGDLVPSGDSKSAVFTGHLTGAAEIRATSGGLTPTNSGLLTVVAGSASKLAFIQQPSDGLAGATIAPPVTVQTQDAFGNSVTSPERSITVALSSGTGTLTGTKVRTSTLGLGTFNDLKIDSTGNKILTATSSGLTAAISDTFTLTAWTITASAGVNGTISPSGSIPVINGANQAFTITPNTGYHIDSVIVDGSPAATTSPYTFTNVTANHTIRAVFAPNVLSITVTTNPSGKAITVDGVNYTSPQTFNWVANTTHTISTDTIHNLSASQRHTFSSWSDAGARTHQVTPLVNTTYTAALRTQFFLTMNANAGGTVSPSSNWNDSGAVVQISGTPTSGYSFSSWSGTGTGSFTGSTNPVNITIRSAITQTGNFTQNNVLVTVMGNPPDRLFRVNTVAYTTQQTFSFQPGSTQLFSTDSIQFQTASSRSIFDNWTDGGSRAHNFIVPSKDTTVIVNFRTQFFVTMSAGTGGTVSPSSNWFDSSASVQISATPALGNSFSGWTGSGTGSYSGPNNPATISVRSAITETGSFTLTPVRAIVKTNPRGRSFIVDGVTYTDSVAFTWSATQSHSLSTTSPQYSVDSLTRYNYSSWSDGGNQSHNVAPLTDTTFTVNFSTQYMLTMAAGAGGAVSPASGYQNAGANVNITATPSANFTFAGWTGSGTGSFTGITNPASVTMNEPITETGSFTATIIQVTVQTNPPGRSILVDDTLWTSPKTFNWAAGSSHSIATDSIQAGSAGTQYVWTSWTGGGTRVRTVAPTTNTTYTANFKTQFFLTMSAGTGGSVTPISDWKDSAAIVSIQATPQTGYSFSGWSGSGTGSFTGLTNPVNITVRSPITESASFTLNTISITVATVPSGKTIRVDGVPRTSPYTFSSLAGVSHDIDIDSIHALTSSSRHAFTAWSDSGARSHSVAPLVNTTYTATLRPQFFLTMVANEGGTVTPPSDWKDSAQVVQLNALPNTGWSFTNWQGVGSGSVNTATNPVNITVRGAITQTANFTQNDVLVTIQTNPTGRTFYVDGSLKTSTYTYSHGPSEVTTLAADSIQNQVGTARYIWKNWSDGGTRVHNLSFPTKDTTIVVNFARQYFVTMSAGTGGTVTPTSAWHDSNAVVQITAAPNSGYSFSSWSGTGTVSFSGNTNPANITVRGPITQTASFTNAPVNLTVKSSPRGRSFTIAGVPYSDSATVVVTAHQAVSISTTSPQYSVDSLTRYTYASWSDGGNQTHSVTPTGDTTLTVNFNTQYFLAMAADTGGTVSPASGYQAAGSTVQITATPSSTYDFVSWTGTGTGSHTGSNNPATVTMSGPITETAHFTLKTIQVTVQTLPAGRTIIVDDTIYTSPRTFNWVATSSHVITTDSLQDGSPGSRYAWTSWTGATGTGRTRTVTPSANATYTANFKTQYFLTMIAGTGGTVSPVTNWNDSGTVVAISATPQTGYSFTTWSGSGTGSFTGTKKDTTVTMRGPITQTGNFALNTISITVTTNPSGKPIKVDGIPRTSPYTFNSTAGVSHSIETDSIHAINSTYRHAFSAWNDTSARVRLIAPFVNTTYTATLRPQFFVTMNANTGGTVSPPSNWFDSAQVVSINAIPNPTYVFSSWTGTGTGSFSGSINPTNITVRSPITETANFDRGNVLVRVQGNPADRLFRVDGIAYTTPQIFSFQIGSTHLLSTDSLQAQTSTRREILTNWSDGGSRAHNIIIPDRDTTYTVNFKPQYFLTMNTGTGGTVSPSSNWNDSGAVVQISGTPSSGYSFAGWTGSGNGSYTGPNSPHNITIGGAITQTGSFTTAPVRVTVKTSPRGRKFLVDGTEYSDSLVFTWTATQSHQLSVASPQYAGDSLSRYFYSSWSDGGSQTHTVAPLTDTTFTVNFTTQYFLTMVADTGGTVSPASGWFNSGSNVNISATPSTGYGFAGWTGTGVGSVDGVSTNPATVTMNSPITQSAHFSLNTIQVTVQTSPPGRTIIVDDSIYTSPRVFNWLASSSHTIAVDSLQDGALNTRYAWTSWTGGGTRVRIVAPLVNTTYTANFKTQFMLTMNAGTGGTVSPASDWRDSGAVVQITATPSTGYSFASWSGTGTGSTSGITNPVNITVRSPITQTAGFTPNPITVTIAANLTNRKIRVDGVEYTAPRAFNWIANEPHTIEVDSIQSIGTDTRAAWSSWSDNGVRSHVVTPLQNTTYTATFRTQYYLTMVANTGGTVNPPSDWFNSGAIVTITALANAGYSFSSWTGVGSGSYGGTNSSQDIQINGPIRETANFIQNPYQVIIQTDPPGRSFAINGFSYNIPQTRSVQPGNSLTLSIPSNPQAGPPGTQYAWSNWSDSGSITHVLSPTSDTVITANFTTQYYLTTIAQSGGAVSPPSGWFNAGQQVPLTATPEGAFTFSGWRGSGDGSYTGPNNPATVMMNGPISDTATFTLFPVTVTFESNPPGQSIIVDGTSFQTPKQFIWTSGTTHPVSADSIQGDSLSGRVRWLNWSDGGSRSHTVSTNKDTTFVVNFQRQFYLNMIADAGGTATPASGWFDSSQSVQLTGIPSEGYLFSSWIGEGDSSYNGTANPATIRMRSHTGERATFAPKPIQVTVTTNPPGKIITVDDTVYTSPKTFTWLAHSPHTISTDSIQAGTSSTRPAWTSWSDGGARVHQVTPTSNTTYTANFRTQFFVTMNANAGGTVSPTSNWFDSTQVVAISATPEQGYSFASWSGSGLGSYSGTNNPANITVRSAITEIANFSQNAVLVTIRTNPAGRTFLVNGTSYTNVNTFSLTPGVTRTLSADSIQNVTTGIRYVWTNWSDSAARTHSFIVPDRDTTIIVSFRAQYSLTTTASPLAGGSISPSSLTYYDAGDTADILATGNSGYTFSHWSGNASGSENPLALIMDSPKSVTGNFLPAYAITINTTPAGRSIMVDDSIYIAPQTFHWVQGSAHTIEAISPQSNSGSRYFWQNWSDGGTARHSITATTNMTVTANYSVQHLLSLDVISGSGTVAPPNGWFDEGAQVTLTATPDSGFEFISWTGNGSASYTGTRNPVTITMTSPVEEDAQFGPILPPPTLAGIPDGTGDLPTSLRLSWMTYPDAASYILQLSTDSLFSVLTVDSSGIADTSFALSALQNGQTYYWRVKVIGTNGVSTFSEKRMFITRPKSIQVQSPAEVWATGFVHTIQWSTVDLSGNVTIKVSTDGGSSYPHMLQQNISNSGLLTMTIPRGFATGSQSRVRIESVNDPAIFGTSGLFQIVSGSLPSVVPLQGSIPYPADPISSTNYRMVSLPGILDGAQPISSFLPGSSPLDWRMFTDNGLPQNYLVEMNGESRFATGTGYWLVKKNNFDVGMNMSVPALDTVTATYSITLHAGWNIIANPFDKPVLWSSVVAVNNLAAAEAYSYDGSYIPTSELKPFHGYYYFNETNLATLKVPYPFGNPVAQTVQQPAMEWKLQLSLNSDVNDDPENFIGVARAASEGLDKLDRHKPPLFLDQSFLYFPRPEWNESYSLFRSDVRPAINKGQSWNFEVSKPRGSKGTIDARGIENVPAEYDVVLINSYNNIPHDLRKQPRYAFTAISKTMPFTILVGRKDYIDKELQQLVPKEFELKQNFPNPFNNSTAISIRLPKETRVRLEVYSILGQHITTIADDNYPAGTHTFFWNGMDASGQTVASGVYLYRLLNDAQLVQTKKMVLTK